MIDQIQLDLNYIFQKTRHLICELDKKTIFLTGGTGFIGKWILEYLLFLNTNKCTDCQIFVLSRDPEKFLKTYPKFRVPLISFIKGDVNRIDYKQLPFSDIVIHAATDTDAALNLAQPLNLIDTIINGTRNILNYSVKIQSKKILFLSSGAVYGIQPEAIKGFSEDYFGGPDFLLTTSAYSEAKRIAELTNICYKNQYNLNVSIARCFAFVGPYLPLNKHFAIGNFIGNGLKGEDIIINGNGLPLRSYMYTSDLVIWLLYVLLKGENGQAYNVGSDDAVSIKELAVKISSFFPNLSVKVLGELKPTDRNQNYIPCIKKIKSELNVPDIFNLDEAIYRTIQFYKG